MIRIFVSKKAFSFFYFLFVFTLVIALLNYIFYIQSTESEVGNLKIDETFEKYDKFRTNYFVSNIYYDRLNYIKLSYLERDFIFSKYEKNILDNGLRNCVNGGVLIYFDENYKEDKKDCILRTNNADLKDDFSNFLETRKDYYFKDFDKSFNYEKNRVFINLKKDFSYDIYSDILTIRPKSSFKYSYSIDLDRFNFIFFDLGDLFLNKDISILKKDLKDCIRNFKGEINILKREECYDDSFNSFLSSNSVNLDKLKLKLKVKERSIGNLGTSSFIVYFLGKGKDDFFVINFLFILNLS